jgi:hypothetical protein
MMATFYGVEATKAYNSDPKTMISKGEFNGRVQSLRDIYTLSADLASSDVIVMGGKLPAGARVLDVFIKWADLDASGGTIDVGWAISAEGNVAADDDGFFANLDVTSAGSARLSDSTHSANAGMMKEFDEAVAIQVKIDGDTDATSGSIEMFVLYVVA